MAKDDDEGIPFEDYIKVKPEPFVRTMLDCGQLRYTWMDADGNARASDDSGLQPPKGWWLMVSTAFDRERHSVRGFAFQVPAFPEMFFVKVYPAPAVEQPAQEVPRRGRRSSKLLVLEEATRRLQGNDRALHIQGGRKHFLAELSKWHRDKHPKAPSMAAKTIGDHLRDDPNVRGLLPVTWVRRK